MKETIRSARKYIVGGWGESISCAPWIPFIGEMAKHGIVFFTLYLIISRRTLLNEFLAYFTDAIPILLDLWVEATVQEDKANQDIEKSLISALVTEKVSGST